MQPLAVIFDCDGVLVDSEWLAMESELARLAALGLAYDLADYRRRFLGLNDAAFIAALDADRRARQGVGLPAGFLHDLHADRHADVDARLKAVPGAAAAVAALKAPKAVASSSGTAFLEHKLRRTDLWAPFAPHVYSADLVARAKPAPDIFLFAAHALGADPARCLVIEDSANGVRAARAAGMTVWGFTGGRHCADDTDALLRAAGADEVVRDWDEARVRFGGW